MAKLISCKVCSKEVASSAGKCPHCGAPISGGGGKFRRVVLGMIGLVVLLGFIGALLGNHDQSSTDSRGASASAPPTPELSINAIRLVEDYEANEVAADQKYKGKTIEVNGMVGSVGKDILNSMYVTLGQREDDIASAQLFFAKEHENELASLSRGQFLDAVCVCDGKMMNVILKNCQIEGRQTK
ncbi:MAG TPA: hypothetical protein VMV27_01995 [Candidatus Binataceae bacterium]|nr:hypothetical protein [Candidatus Binataceae bacterium]